ncbi:uncharacterized protein MELLADRAFT_87962 [Melampsora larici-populina 98AG31]|uniref:CxC5 like cysteine cluster associated with KDZ domain-containing protein n=1 Tax=Melampsora larici-populina (strain 98AG31 / pathotype 3-4-7) TaxID=747676 RepID=F4RQJ6_MELLP|nr:uncharacterized protein MELLADRAFT_87962 [Melampsora larici-populina 98AG31]EGG05310.1 hypothetical protein MELLADRAFT_87962 [Melampsora larici-populina 98AG31]
MYDLDGIHLAEFHTWACLDCKTYYRPSYYTHKKARFYYSDNQRADPQHFQVHCHFGMSYRLARMFWQSQMLGHTSHFNLANLFNVTHFNSQQVPTHAGTSHSFSPKMSPELARDAVDLFSLLRRCKRRGAILQLNAHGQQEDRLLPTMARELHHVANHGSKYRDHFCSYCVKVFEVEHGGNVALKAIRAVVTDGLTIGHWRCSASSVQLEELAHRANAPPPNGVVRRATLHFPGGRKFKNLFEPRSHRGNGGLRNPQEETLHPKIDAESAWFQSAGRSFRSP